MNTLIKKLTSVTPLSVAFILLSLLMAAYGPMTITNAESAAETQALMDLKEKATKEINRRIANYEEVLKSLNEDKSYHQSIVTIINKDGTKTTSSGLDEENTGDKLLLPQTIKDKAKDFLQTLTDQLKTLRDKVASTTSLEDMKALAKNIDAQYLITQFADQQAAVAKGINSLSGVYSKVQGIKDKLNNQLDAIKTCGKEDSNSSASPTPSADAASGDEINIDCDKVNDFLSGKSVDLGGGLQAKMIDIGSILSAIGSILKSAVSLFMTIIQTFISFITGLFSGGLSALTSLFNIGNLTSLLGGLGGGGGLGAGGGLSTALSSIIPQLGNATSMAGNASGALGNVTGLIGTIPGLGSFNL